MAPIPGWLMIVAGALVAGFSKFVEVSTDTGSFALFFWIGIFFVVFGIGKYVVKGIRQKKNQPLHPVHKQHPAHQSQHRQAHQHQTRQHAQPVNQQQQYQQQSQNTQQIHQHHQSQHHMSHMQGQHHIQKAQHVQHVQHPTTQQPTIVPCQRCGTRHYSYADFCMRCGTRIIKK